jgi:cytochrome c2
MSGLAMRAIAWIPAMLVGASGVAHAGGDLARGEKLYEDCVACHPIERSVHGIGPTLYGILGRKAGEMADCRYSRALRDSRHSTPSSPIPRRRCLPTACPTRECRTLLIVPI